MTLRPGLILLFFTCLAPVLIAQDGPAKPRPEDTEVWKPEPRVVTPGPEVILPPPFGRRCAFRWQECRRVGDHKQEGASFNGRSKTGRLEVNKKDGNIETKPHRFKDYQLHLEYRIPEDIKGSGQGQGQQRPLPGLHRPRRRRIRAAGPRQLQQQDLRQRHGRQHLQAGDPPGQPLPQARRVAILRHRLDGPALQSRWLTGKPGLRHRHLQRRPSR